MFGLPDETDAQISETAQLLSELDVDGVKLHNLHVLRNTTLEKLFNESKFSPIELEEYSRKVAIFLENLSPKIAVHRLSAVASRWDQLVAPAWTREKMRPTQFIDDYLAANETWQGRNYSFIES
jgi:radical SAM superfamily enzyme